jgi:hypothetical protein
VSLPKILPFFWDADDQFGLTVALRVSHTLRPLSELSDCDGMLDLNVLSNSLHVRYRDAAGSHLLPNGSLYLS